MFSKSETNLYIVANCLFILIRYNRNSYSLGLYAIKNSITIFFSSQLVKLF